MDAKKRRRKRKLLLSRTCISCVVKLRILPSPIPKLAQSRCHRRCYAHYCVHDKRLLWTSSGPRFSAFRKEPT